MSVNENVREEMERITSIWKLNLAWSKAGSSALHKRSAVSGFRATGEIGRRMHLHKWNFAEQLYHIILQHFALDLLIDIGTIETECTLIIMRSNAVTKFSKLKTVTFTYTQSVWNILEQTINHTCDKSLLLSWNSSTITSFIVLNDRTYKENF